jgi:hypothetical protein
MHPFTQFLRAMASVFHLLHWYDAGTPSVLLPKH